MRISKPSFKIKKAREICFSSDSKFLYSIGSRLNAFSLEERKEVYSEKLIKHDIYISINQNDKLLCIKNTNGELVTCLANGGDIQNKTGRIKHYNEGEEIYFSQCNNFLIDMSWSGAIQIYNAKTLEIEFKIEAPADYMITSSSFNKVDNSYVIYYQARDKERSPPFITVLSEEAILSNDVTWSTQKNWFLKYVFGFAKWSEQKLILLEKTSSLSLMSINPEGNKLAIIYISKFKKLESFHSLAIIDLLSGEIEREKELFPYMTQINGISWSPDSRFAFISTDFLPDDSNLTFYERYDKYHPHSTCKIHIVNTETININKSIPFPEARKVIFSNDSQYVAIASTIKGLVLHRSHVNDYFGVDLL